jgi:Flp pilus assembly protein TadD
MALINVAGAIQWALYYPAVVNPDDLHLTADETSSLSQVLSLYRAGDLLAALGSWPTNFAPESASVAILLAQLELTVGGVAQADAALAQSEQPAARALRELIAVVKGEPIPATAAPQTSSEFLAQTYHFQRQADLPTALAAAQRAVDLAPEFGFARARLADLQFSFGYRRPALAELERALKLSPRLAPAHALRGYILLAQGNIRDSLEAFDHARELDAAFSPAWLGQGLCFMRQRNFQQAQESFQAAAALEPQRGLFRAYMGKAASEQGDGKLAEKEFNLAKRLDPKDPTAWLYSALELWQQNRINEALLDLQTSQDLNDQRAVFRSRFLLDKDRSIRSADQAALYADAGFPEVSQHTASRSVTEDYANFSGHLFLSQTYQNLQDENRFDLRLETARQSELLVANLLAPPGAGNLSQLLPEQEHLRFFDPRPIGISTLTEYGSNGDWHQAGTAFGTVDGFSYALDADYLSINGQRPNNDSESKQFFITAKQRVSPDDDAYFQAGYFSSEAGDVANRYYPSNAVLGFRVEETQKPTLYAGWHHQWSPGNHTLFLASRLEDHLSYTNPEPNTLFLLQSGGQTIQVEPPPPFFPAFRLHFASEFVLHSIELQQIWENERASLIVGGRWQSGDIDTHSHLNQDPLGPGFQLFSTNQSITTSLERGNAYAYGSLQVFEPLRLIGGVSYDHIRYPENTDLPPISDKETSRELVAPKAGLLFQPWKRGFLRADYSQSLGGLFFDNSVRLEPSQIAGFNQAFRSLIPESVAGLVPGTKFETAGVGFDQSFSSGTWLGAEAEWLTSNGRRTVGVLTNSLPAFLNIPDSSSSTTQTLDFRERDLSVYAAQLLGKWFSLTARYRLSEANLDESFPDITDTAVGLNHLEASNRALLNKVGLGANFYHPSGFFAQWESVWYDQRNSGYSPPLADSNFWQHNIFVGYRFPRRYAEIRFGFLNLFDRDYNLNPLNLLGELPRTRTFTASLRLNF